MLGGIEQKVVDMLRQGASGGCFIVFRIKTEQLRPPADMSTPVYVVRLVSERQGYPELDLDGEVLWYRAFSLADCLLVRCCAGGGVRVCLVATACVHLTATSPWTGLWVADAQYSAESPGKTPAPGRAWERLCGRTASPHQHPCLRDNAPPYAPRTGAG